MVSEPSARVHPLGQEPRRVARHAAVEGDAALTEAVLQRAGAEHLQRLGGAPDGHAADKDLGDGGRAKPLMQVLADLAAEVALLERDRIEIDAAVGDAGCVEELAYRPGKL